MPALKKVNSLQELGNSLKAIFTKTISYLLLPINSRKGFTLIELLITISIIAIISAIGLISYSQTQKIARDAKRKQDLRAVSVALELYYQANRRFPCKNASPHMSSVDSNPFWIRDPDFATCGSTVEIPLENNYINRMPIDPINNGNPSTSTTNYGYSYNGGNTPGVSNCPANLGQYYVLRTVLENGNDPDSCKNKLYKRCDGFDFCTGNPGDTNNNQFIITSQ